MSLWDLPLAGLGGRRFEKGPRLPAVFPGWCGEFNLKCRALAGFAGFAAVLTVQLVERIERMGLDPRVEKLGNTKPD